MPIHAERPFRIVVLASGEGTTFEHLAEEFSRQTQGRRIKIAAVVSNNHNAGVLNRAAARSIPAVPIDHRGLSNEEHSRRIAAAVKEYEPDLVVMAGYLRVLSGEFINAFRGRVINVHPALLPKYGGPGMYGHHVHEAVLANGDAESGATVHWATPVVDGGSIIRQVRVPVAAGESPDSLAEKVRAEEKPLLARVIRDIAEGRVALPSS